jgi:hypothetical protein
MPSGAPDYFKRILLYGIYQGQAVPLACDEQGRLILIAEPVSPWDKSGTILLQDTFECGLVKCTTSAVGAGAAVALDSSTALEGGYSCKLTAGSTGDKLASLLYYHSVRTFDKLGLEFSIRFGANIDNLWMIWQLRDGSYVYDARLLYNFPDDEWRVFDWNANAWVTFLSGLSYPTNIALYHRIKLVIDIPNRCYHAFRYLGSAIDLSAYLIRKVASIKYPYSYLWFMLTSMAGANGVGYVDNFIFTQDES